MTQVNYCKALVLGSAIIPALALAQHDDLPYLRMVTNGYAVIASPTIDITLTPMTNTQFLLSPHLMVETDLLVEQIQVKYNLGDDVLQRSILLTQRAAQPFIRFAVIQRDLLDNAERVTIQMESNIPQRVIESSSVRINGQPVRLSPDNTYQFTAYSPQTEIQGEMMISNSQVPVTGKSVLKHAILPDIGCDLVDENKRFYALCYANQAGLQTVQFYWKGEPIGANGEVGYIPDMVNDLRLTYRVGGSRYQFAIIESDNGYSFGRTDIDSN